MVVKDSKACVASLAKFNIDLGRAMVALDRRALDPNTGYGNGREPDWHEGKRWIEGAMWFVNIEKDCDISRNEWKPIHDRLMEVREKVEKKEDGYGNWLYDIGEDAAKIVEKGLGGKLPATVANKYLRESERLEKFNRELGEVSRILRDNDVSPKERLEKGLS